MDAPADPRSDLLRAEAYGVLAPARVDFVETHVSRVFLLERDVFKVKKPVELGFLDFRTLAQRKAACDAEVRLNARLAPDVYLGVVPVRRAPGGRARIDGGDDAPIVDWAVHMRRLPDEVRADRLLARGALSDVAIEAVASRLAAFHAGARCDEHTARHGTAASVGANVAENFAQTRDAIGSFLSTAQARELEDWQSGVVREGAALFDRRIAAGRVRDGHGDLRLEHVYFEAGEAAPPTIIDCVEFNDRFRFADVCADLAFLSMDLVASGRPDLAERLLARYARESNDFDLYGLVDFYESYRAFVRAKVSTFVLADPAIDVATRRHVEHDARRYFLLALAGHRRSLLRPAVVGVGGVIASGKSTVAVRLADAMSAPVVEADRTRKSMLGVDASRRLDEHAWQGAYDPGFTEKVYAEVLRRAEVVLASGRPVVVDASFRSRAMRRVVRDLAARFGVPFHFVECRADREVCRARLVERARAASVSDGRLEIFDAFCARFEPIDELSGDELTTVDTARPIEENVAALRARLETWPIGLVA